MATINYLTLKRAAEELGVHEQTLRAWERKGLIQLARLPQSGYRRVPTTEIERLRSTMMTKRSTVQVILVPPRRDEQSVERAKTLSAEVASELKTIWSEKSLSEQNFDTYLDSRRGRLWLQ